MKQLIITPDDHGYRDDIHTFLSYDLENKFLLYKHPKMNELDCRDLEGMGRSTFRPFGISYGDGFLHIVSNNRMAYFHPYNYSHLGMVDAPLFLNTHQILKSNNILYTTNTSNDTIGIYNFETGVNKFLRVTDFSILDSAPTPWQVYSHDLCHVNSLCEHENKIYFCLHNHGKKLSRFGYFDKDTLEVELLADAGFNAHNIVILDDHLYSLSSGTGEVIEIDLKTKTAFTFKLINSDTTFLRGLDVYDGKLLIGCSNNHKAERIIYKDNCYITLLDTNTGQSERYMEIPDAYVITDLKII